MDLTQGLISANAPISDNNGVDAYQKAAANSADIQAKAQTNENARYAQDLQYRLQAAIQESIGTNGLPDPVKLRAAGAKYGISAQTIQYTVDNLPKYWKAAADINKSKTNIAATNPNGEQALTQSWDSQPANASKSGSTQETSMTPAVPNAPATSSASTDSSTPTTAVPTPDTSGAAAAPTTPSIPAPAATTPAAPAAPADGTTPSQPVGSTDTIVTPGQPREDKSGTFTAPDPFAGEPAPTNQQAQNDTNFFAQANAMEPDITSNPQPVQVSNPLQLGGMDQATQDKMLAQLRQDGLLGQWANGQKRSDYIAAGQTALDASLKREVAAIGDQPTKQMFTDADGNFNNGAYNLALSKYHGDVATAIQKDTDKYGKAYADQLAQDLQLQANSRANQANNRANVEQGNAIGSGATEASSFNDTVANLNQQLSKDKLPTVSAAQIGTPDKLAAFQTQANAYHQVLTLASKKKLTPQESIILAGNMLKAEGLSGTVGSEEMMQNSAVKGVAGQAALSALRGEKLSGDMLINSVTKSMATKLEKDPTLAVRESNFPNVVNQYAGTKQKYVPSTKPWSQQPANKPKAKAKAAKPTRRVATAADFGL